MVSKNCLRPINRATVGLSKRRAYSNSTSIWQSEPPFGSYRRALIRKIDVSLPEKAIRLSSSNVIVINMQLAIQQHDLLQRALISSGVIIDELPADDMADSVFIEDTVVIVGDTAMITYPGAVSRRAEGERVKSVLETSHGSALRVIQQTEGTLDGGDVLFTGGG